MFTHTHSPELRGLTCSTHGLACAMPHKEKKRSFDEATAPAQDSASSSTGNKTQKSRKSPKIKGRTTTPRTNESSYQLVRPEYYFERHLRKVRPYFFEYQIYAKARWLGVAVGRVLQEEFRDRPVEYYAQAMALGLITINGQACTFDQVLCNSDLISHRLHRHEPPISSTPIEILFNDGKLLVVNKPASMPVHPSGRYRFNSLVEILKHDLQISTSLGLVNRLDRLTSGVCILSVGGASTQLHRDMAAKTSTQTSTSISSRPCFLKSYLARVKGQFPPRVITCDKPLRLLSHKLGVVVVDEEAGKDAYTSFEFLRPLGAEGEHSLVRCVPRTGRTHQIRVHLLHLGFPIANDPLYNHPCWGDYYGDNAGAADSGTITDSEDRESTLERVLQTLMRAQLLAEQGEEEQKRATAAPCAYGTINCCTDAGVQTATACGELNLATEEGARSDASPSCAPLCADCAVPLPDPSPEQLCLFLHAHHYHYSPSPSSSDSESGDGWSYTATPPDWTHSDEAKEEGNT